MASLASLIASVVLLFESLLAVVNTSWDSLVHEGHGYADVEALSVQFLKLIDSILLGTVLYIIALGLFQLFFQPDLPMPDWLRLRNLSELKESVIEVILVLLGVLFVSRAVSWSGGREILDFGLSIAAVVAALGLVLWIGHLRTRNHREH